jgi:NADP-dependent 3-hydroxy acid dehydrogenase YdfG
LVTGASSGIGEACVRALTVDGWTVWAGARREERLGKLAAELGPSVRAIKLDITDAAAVDAMADRVTQLDVLVNCAGMSRADSRILDADPAQWRELFEMNVLGTLRVTQRLMPALLRSDNALIVIINSMASQAPSAGGGGYAVAKTALSAMTTVLRKEIPLHTALRITELNPGRVRTEFHLTRFGGDAERAAQVYRARGPGIVPLEPGDIAECVRWLATLPARVNVDIMNVVPVDQVDPAVGQRRG